MATEDSHGDWGKLLDIFKEKGKSVLLPGIAATLGAGGLSSYMTSREGLRPGENPEERRARILRNGLIASGLTGGTILGGTALSALGEHSFKKKTGPNIDFPLIGTLPGDMFDWGWGYAGDQPLAAAAGGVAGYGGGTYAHNKLFGSATEKSLKDLASKIGVKPDVLAEAARLGNLEPFIQKMRTKMPNDPKGVQSIMKQIHDWRSTAGLHVSSKIPNQRISNMVLNMMEGPDPAMRRFHQAGLGGKRKYILPILSALGFTGGAARAAEGYSQARKNIF